MVATVQDGVVAPVHSEAGVIFLLAGWRTPWAGIAMLSHLGVVDEPLLLCGRHLALLCSVFGAVKRTVCGHPISCPGFTFVSDYREALAIAVVQYGAVAALIHSLLAAGEWFVHLLSSLQTSHLITAPRI
jgi:hypothetical protein